MTPVGALDLAAKAMFPYSLRGAEAMEVTKMAPVLKGFAV